MKTPAEYLTADTPIVTVPVAVLEKLHAGVEELEGAAPHPYINGGLVHLYEALEIASSFWEPDE